MPEAALYLSTRSFWKKNFPRTWVLASGIAALLAIPRFIFMLQGNTNYVLILFAVMWFIPTLLLNRTGRKQIGITTPHRARWLTLGFPLGIAAALMLHYIGYALFDRSRDNWFITIMNSFNSNDIIQSIGHNLLFFLVFALPTMIFSPIGEEFFYRGIMHEAFLEKFGSRAAVLANASFFGVTHLAHHGLVIQPRLEVLPSAVLWIILMMLISVLFSVIRKKSGSIWGAVFCHAGFNLGMMWSIFYLLN